MIHSETLELLEWPRLCEHLATFAATKLGVVASWQLSIPSTLEETEQLLSQTKEAYRLETSASGGLSFEGICDISDSIERAKRQGVLSGEELLDIATTLAGVRGLRRTIDNEENLPVLTALVADLRTYPEIEQQIHHCIDERGKVADRASVKLGEIRHKLRLSRDRIYQTLQNIIQRHGNAVQQQVITQRDDRFVIPIKASHKDAIPGIVHDTSTSGATLYVEPYAISDANNQMRVLVRQEKTEEEVIRRTLTEQVGAVAEDLELLVAIATTLDLATARARYSLWLGANPPSFIDITADNRQEQITLRQLRHPLLVWQQQHEQGPAVVPVDLAIPPQIRVVAITGPNTGGKTVTLKTLGLAALMAKVGMFLPAREPVEIPWFDMVLADIGDEQSLQQSLSTFSGHIRRIGRILEQITPASLVLLDEVGAGTDPSEGSALAIALLKYLADNACLTVATTHYGELKALKYDDARFENAAVEFDDISLSPTYRLLWGIPGRSNALTIASRLGLAGEIIALAKSLVAPSGGAEIERAIAGLEEQRRRQETKAQQAAALLQATEQLNRELSAAAASLEERERQLKWQKEQEVQQELERAKAEIAKVIRQLQQGTPTGQDAQQATLALEQISQQHLPSRQKVAKPKPEYKPQLGERIRIPKLGQTAEVLEISEESQELTVRFGIMKMTVLLEDIESLDGQKPTTTPKGDGGTGRRGDSETGKKGDGEPRVAVPTIRTSRNTVDIRGSRVADGEVELDRAIAAAIPTSGAVWIVHGKGTGKLRQGVHAFLAQHPQISHYELAPEKEGGSGVTIAYLK
ncbi:MAG TPA: endonuclease MutS2 [Oscillatoriaceae cyanobacterium M33_DOE_052]|uniref:Endonuclease MutS2 n=1 Tax=Planktothricoides sp. SpSt-374 TaxID=2282167 RepID=A0A7C3VT29_9CYAN|nr:endonuclease MutS2 [Oscillatoriaceae cyanobacterium M33_DOE_052]